MAITRADFPLPDLDDERIAPYFAAAARGELAIPRCDGCGAWIWYPAAECPRCGSRASTWTSVSGRSTLFSWVVVRRAFLPAFEDQVPFTSALVALDEDPSIRLVTRLVGADGMALLDGPTLVAGAPMIVTFATLRFATVPGREVVVPYFMPAP